MPLTIADLHSLLYGFEAYESFNPLSKHPLDHVTLHRIRIVPLNVGAEIAAADPDGKLFHIEFFAAINRAEIWAAQAWRESMTRHLRLKDKQRAADPLYSLQSRLTIVESQIVYHLFSTIAIVRTRAEAAAQAITRAENPEYVKAFEILNPPADLIDDILNIRAEFQKLAPLIPANHPLANALAAPTPQDISITTAISNGNDNNATSENINDAGEEYPSRRN